METDCDISEMLVALKREDMLISFTHPNLNVYNFLNCSWQQHILFCTKSNPTGNKS